MKFSVEGWMNKVRAASSTKYNSVWVDTSCGRTHLLAPETNSAGKPDVLFIHGWRGNGLFWDLNDNIKQYTPHFNVYLIDVIGQPGLSAKVPDDFVLQRYGVWLSEVVEGLKLSKINIVSVSHGCFITLVFSTVSPQLINKTVLLAPAGLTGYAAGMKTIYRSMLSMLKPSQTNAEKLLKDVMLNKQWQNFTAFDLLADYMAYAFGEFESPAVAPFRLKDEYIKMLTAPTQVLIGLHDKVFSPEKVIKAANKNITGLRHAGILHGLDHGLEISKEVITPVTEFLRD